MNPLRSPVPISGLSFAGSPSLATLGAGCAPPKSVYATTANGNIQYDK